MFGIEREADGFRTLAFWSWDGRLEEEKLRSQIGDMSRAGMGGFIIHARGGLRTEYLSEEWFGCVRACVSEARERGMQVWIYDEQGWPSGFVGGRLLKNPDLLAHYLTAERTPEWRADADFHYRARGDGFVRVHAPEPGADYVHVTIRTSPSNVDILNPEVTEQFLQMTHEEYFRRFEGEFRRGEIQGFFTDEPQYFRYATPWSEEVRRTLLSEGREVCEKLPLLFFEGEGAEEFRYDYWSCLHRLYIERFVRRIYEWCCAHGCKLTGHTIEESTLSAQMWCCGGAMPFYEYEHVPCVDSLGRVPGSELEGRQAGSMAAQTGAKRVLTETFACAGWDASLRELRYIAETQYVFGVNMMTEHLYHYSFSGMRKRDYPPAFSPESPWFGEFGAFNDYFSKLGALLAGSREVADTLVIHPMHSAWLRYRREADAVSVAPLDEGILALMRRLSDAGVSFHFGDECFLSRRGSVSGSRLRAGERSYGSVVVPDMENLDRSTVGLLRDFVSAGGKLLLLGSPRFVSGRPGETGLCSNTTFEALAGNALLKISPAAGIRWTVREREGRRFVYLVNCTGRAADLELTLPGAEAPARLDFASMTLSGLPGRCGRWRLRLEESESAAVFFSGGGAPSRWGEPVLFPVEEIGDSGNLLPVDCARAARGEGPFSEPRYLPALMEELIKAEYRGPLRLRYCFRLEHVPRPLTLVWEDMGEREILLNGRPVAGSPGSVLSREFLSAEISGLAETGENVLEFSLDFRQGPDVRRVLYDEDVTESEKNCLLLGTELETVYLFGDFSVVCASLTEDPQTGIRFAEGPYSVLAPDRSLPMEGRPFFAGRVRYRVRTEGLAPGRCRLRAVGRFAAVSLRVDGAQLPGAAFGDWTEAEIGPDSRVELEIVSGNRNLYGPHHYAPDPEPLGVAPEMFTMWGSWTEGESPLFRPSCSLVPFGAAGVEIQPIASINKEEI